jgi:hypothetical protein
MRKQEMRISVMRTELTLLKNGKGGTGNRIKDSVNEQHIQE